MAFFSNLSYLSRYGGELHRKGGVLLKAGLSEWERELQYLRFRIAEWKQFGSADHKDYYGFRTFLLQKVQNHLLFELKVRSFFRVSGGWALLRTDPSTNVRTYTRCGKQTLSTILMACEVAAQSDDVPPLQSYVDSVFAFRERISHGEITRRIHLEQWHLYMRVRDEEADDTQSQMDDMFAKMRNEIDGMDRRSKEFKSMVDELVRMVAGMQEIMKPRQGAIGAIGGGSGLQIRVDGLVNVNGFWVRSATRIPPYAAHRHDAASARAMTMTRSPSDVLPMPNLVNSRARLPPLTSIHLPPPPPSPLPTANSTTPARGRFPTSISSISSASRSRRQHAVTSSPAVISRTTGIILPSSSPSRSRSPPPPRTARNIHRRLFQRVFHTSQNSNTPPRHRTRTPSPAARAPSPLDTPPMPSPPLGTGFSSYESPSASLIAETRTRLPPPLELSPIPYRPPGHGQRLFSFLHRL